MTGCTITLTIPRSEWWTQNRRGHWRASWTRTRQVKARAYLEGQRLKHDQPDTFTTLATAGRVHVTATIHPLTHGRFDPENAAPMVKAILDALTQCALWPDDDSQHLTGPDYRAGTPSTTPGHYLIDIHITPATQETPQ